MLYYFIKKTDCLNHTSEYSPNSYLRMSLCTLSIDFNIYEILVCVAMGPETYYYYC